MKVCFVAHTAAPLMGRPSGGLEGQTVLLARHLEARGHDVTLVVPGLAGDPEVIEGVRLISGWQPDRGLRFVRAFTYRYPTLRRTLAGLRADAYYIRGVAYYTPSVVDAAHAANAHALVALASDRDLYPEAGRHSLGLGGPLAQRLTGRAGFAYFRRHGLLAADCILAQNDDQMRSCDDLGLPWRRIRNVVEPPPADLLSVAPSSDCIWVGNIPDSRRRAKGIDELVSLATVLPDCSFLIVGDLSSPHIAAATSKLAALANVVLLGRRPHAETLNAMAACRVVLNTSPSEGFSNVMLEGWALGRPSVTLDVDPDRLLTRDGLGLCAGGNLAVMARRLSDLLHDERRLHTMGAAARTYVSQMHSPGSVCSAFEALVEELNDTRELPPSPP